MGLINDEHVDVIRKAVDRLPGFVDAPTREQFEVDLVRTAVGVGPQGTQRTAPI
ncbi:13E12 repeat family protein [Mycolicibacterium novocastrense]|nr:13E12 repeat family protein [Mycolicibacterium novocastrense]